MEETSQLQPDLKHEENRLPERPESKKPLEPKNNKRKLLIFTALATLLFVAGATATFAYLRLRTPAKTTEVNNTASQSTTHSAPAIESTSFGNVKAAYVTLPLTKTQADTDPIYGPGQNIATASGHYLLLDPTGYTYNATSNEGGKLLYDGKSVYNGPYLFRFALSDNGQHYLYVLDTDPKHSSGNQDIYIDGKKVQSVSDKEGVYYVRLSNNGRDYAFATGKPEGYLSTTELDKNGSTILTVKNGIEVLAFSSDLSKYLLATPSTSTGEKYDLIANGQTVARNVDFMGAAEPSIGLSFNGIHYIYTDGKTIFTENDATQHVLGVAAMAVSDSGVFSVVDPLSNAIHVNSKSYNLPSSFASACNPGCGGAFPEFAMSNDGLHFVFGTQYPNLWNMDGSTITPVGDIENVEFVGDTLYLYRWTDPYAGWKTYTSKLGGISIKYPSNWTAPASPYNTTIMNGTVQEELMTWQSPFTDFGGQQRGVSMSLQALTGYQNCDANLPIYNVQNITVDGHSLSIVTTASSNEIEYLYLTDTTGLSAGSTLPTCSASADIKSPLPQTKTIQLTVQFVTPCAPGSHCGYVNSPLTPQQYSDYPLVNQIVQVFESVKFN